MKSAINLLPTTYRRHLMIRRRLTQWGFVVCATVLLIWAARWYKLREYYVLGQQLEVLAREHHPTQLMIQEITSMRQQLEELDQQERVAQELDQQRHVLTVLGVVSQTAGQSKGRLRVTELKVIDLQQSWTGGKQQTSTPYPGSLALTGVSLDSPSVAELLDKLQHTGLFTSVELVSLNERREADVAVHDFQVRCQL